MIGSFLTSAFAIFFVYAYPAYQCFKTVELNKPEIEQLRFWCQYWILVAALTIFERVGDAFVSWIPMYSEAKVAFFVYLWYPKTRGTTYVYETFFRPYVAKHETEIDRNLLELRTRAGDMVVIYSQRIACYGQTKIFEILQFIASQSPSQASRPRPSQSRQQHQQARSTVPTTAACQPPVSQQSQQLPRPSPPPASPSKKTPVPDSPKARPHSLISLPPPAQPQSSVNAIQPSSLETTSSSKSPIEPEPMQVEVAKNPSVAEPNRRLRKRPAIAGP